MILGFFIAGVLVLVALTWWMYYYNLMSSCYLHPNLVCWTDWTCLKPGGGTSCPAQELYGCTPGTTRDANYCSEGGAGVGTTACSCKYDGSNTPPTGCDCAWNTGGTWTQSGGTCGTKYCTGGNTDNCGPAT